MNNEQIDVVKVDQWDPEVMRKDYCLYCLNGAGRIYYQVLSVLNGIFNDKSVISVVYESYAKAEMHKAYLLTRKDALNETELKNRLENSEMKLEPVDFDVLYHEDPLTLLKLLFYSSVHPDVKDIKKDNISGELMLTPLQQKRAPYHSYELIMRRSTVDKEQIYLKLVMHTYNKVSKFENVNNLPESTKEKLQNGPFYYFDEFGMHVTGKNNKDRVIMAPTGGRHKNGSYLDFAQKTYPCCKIANIWGLMDSVNATFGKALKLSFGKAHAKTVIPQVSCYDDMIAVLKGFVSTREIRIIDAGNDYASSAYCRKLSKAIEEQFNIRPIIDDKDEKSAINLVVIHEPDYYRFRNLDDPYKNYTGAHIQHLTLENCEPFKKLKGKKGEPPRYAVNSSLLEVLVKETILKQDVVNKRFSFVDWKRFGFTEDFTVFQYIWDKVNNRKSLTDIKALTVHPDGGFDYLGSNIPKDLAYDLKGMVFRNALREGCAAIAYGNNFENVTVIAPTEFYPIIGHEIVNAEESLRAGGPGPRNGEMNHIIKEPLLGIQLREFNGRQYYCAGYDMMTMGQTENAPNFYALLPMRGEMPMDKILNLLAVGFVKYKQPTVWPFPSKYLKEIVKSEDKETNNE